MSNNFLNNPLGENDKELNISLNENVNESVSIIVVHKDKPAYLSVCLQSIFLNSSNNSYEVIVVDNNSGPETQEFLDSIQEDVKVIRNNRNLYWSAAANIGAKAANPNSKYFIFMHSDTVVLNPTWMDSIINICEAKGSGMVGVETDKYVLNGQPMHYVMEWCVLMTREGYKKVGGWEEQLPLFGHNFIMTIKAQVNGLKPQSVLKNNFVHHYKIFGVDVNESYKMNAEFKALLPKIYQQASGRTVI